MFYSTTATFILFNQLHHHEKKNQIKKILISFYLFKPSLQLTTKLTRMSNQQNKSIKVQQVFKEKLAAFESTTPAFLTQIVEAMPNLTDDDLKRLAQNEVTLEHLRKHIEEIRAAQESESDEDDEEDGEDDESSEEEEEIVVVKKKPAQQTQQPMYSPYLNIGSSTTNQDAAAILASRASSQNSAQTRVYVSMCNKGFEKDSR